MFTKCIAFLLICMSLSWRGTAGDNLQRYGMHEYDPPSSTQINPAVRCININPQNSVDFQQIMGLWHGSEILMHTPDRQSSILDYNTCVMIHLTDVTNQSYNAYNRWDNDANNRNQNNYKRTQYPPSSTPSFVDNDDYLHEGDQQQAGNRKRYLRLVWSEGEQNLEYMFNYTMNAPGQWSNIGDQRGSLVSHTYTQFSGTVQVVKAVNDHLVLTFCGKDAVASIYTVVLSRNRLGLSADELRSIRNLLSRRGLHTESVRKVCNGAASTAHRLAGLVGLLGAVLLLCMWERH